MKVGDRVVIREDCNSDRWNTSMNEWLGKTMTIRKISGYKLFMEEDSHIKYNTDHTGWAWYEEMIDFEATERLNESPIYNFFEDNFGIQKDDEFTLTDIGGILILKDGEIRSIDNGEVVNRIYAELLKGEIVATKVNLVDVNIDGVIHRIDKEKLLKLIK